MTRLKSHAQLLLALAVVLLLPLCMQSGSLATEVLIYALAVLGCNLLLVDEVMRAGMTNLKTPQAE